MKRSAARIAGPVGAAAAALAFWLLSHGGMASSTSLRAFAEEVDHPVASLATGRLLSVEVQLGQRVRAGETVARLEARELTGARDLARVALEQARAELAAQELVVGEAVARAELQVLRLRTTQSRDRAQLAEVEGQLERLEKLAEDKLVQARDVERGRLLKADLSASVAVLDEAAAKRQAGLGRASGEGVAREQVQRRLAPYREAVRLKEAQLALAEQHLEEATVRAPADGVVALVLHHPGDVVAAGAELLRVAGGRPGVVECWLPERLAGQLEPGREVSLRPSGLFERGFGGRVLAVAPGLEELPLRARVSPSVPAWGRRVVIESWPSRPLYLGEAVHVRF